MISLSRHSVRLTITAVAMSLVVMLLPTPANAITAWPRTDTYSSSSMSAPNFYFDRNWNDTKRSSMVAYISLIGEGERRRIAVQSGSGTGNTNDCTSNQGWAPAGYYGRSDGDPNAKFVFTYKTWGSPTVQGYVWDMGNKYCTGGGTLRTELFVHAQGRNDTSTSSSFITAGCIKVSGDDRGYLAAKYNVSYKKTQGRLLVYG